MTNLVRAQTVLRRAFVSGSLVSFMSIPDLDGSRSPYAIHIPRDAYDDMGEPENITITVEPGDRLNSE